MLVYPNKYTEEMEIVLDQIKSNESEFIKFVVSFCEDRGDWSLDVDEADDEDSVNIYHNTYDKLETYISPTQMFLYLINNYIDKDESVKRKINLPTKQTDIKYKKFKQLLDSYRCDYDTFQDVVDEIKMIDEES